MRGAVRGPFNSVKKTTNTILTPRLKSPVGKLNEWCGVGVGFGKKKKK